MPSGWMYLGEASVSSPPSFIVLTSCSPSTVWQCPDGSTLVNGWGSQGPGGVDSGPPGRHMFPWPLVYHSASCQNSGTSLQWQVFWTLHGIQGGHTWVASYCWSLVSPGCHPTSPCCSGAGPKLACCKEADSSPAGCGISFSLPGSTLTYVYFTLVTLNTHQSSVGGPWVRNFLQLVTEWISSLI